MYAFRDVRWLSGLLARVCEGLLVALPIAVMVWWGVADTLTLAAAANLPPIAVLSLEAWQRVAGAAISLLAVGFLMAGLWQARRFFRLFTAGQVFTADAVRCLRRFAGWVALSVVARVVAGAALSVVLTLSNPPGMKHLAIGVSSDAVLALLFAGMVWVMAAVIARGRALAEENATFV
jgi:hypothetical protein